MPIPPEQLDAKVEAAVERAIARVEHRTGRFTENELAGLRERYIIIPRRAVVAAAVILTLFGITGFVSFREQVVALAAKAAEDKAKEVATTTAEKRARERAGETVGLVFNEAIEAARAAAGATAKRVAAMEVEPVAIRAADEAVRSYLKTDKGEDVVAALTADRVAAAAILGNIRAISSGIEENIAGQVGRHEVMLADLQSRNRPGLARLAQLTVDQGDRYMAQLSEDEGRSELWVDIKDAQAGEQFIAVFTASAKGNFYYRVRAVGTAGRGEFASGKQACFIGRDANWQSISTIDLLTIQAPGDLRVCLTLEKSDTTGNVALFEPRLAVFRTGRTAPLTSASP